MRSIRLWQGLAVAVTLHAALLVAGVFGLELAIQQGAVELPALNLSHSGIDIAAYRTHYPDCPPYSQCPPHSVAPPQEYYVIWILTPMGQSAPTDERRISMRLLILPLHIK